MKVLLLADIDSAHTRKWALGLASAGFTVGLFSFNRASSPWYSQNKNIQVLHQAQQKQKGGSDLVKLNYLSRRRKLKKAIRAFEPDILHAHYATSYGLLGALSRFHPYIISVWGSDIFSFPRKSFLHKLILKYNLKKADYVFSTSNVMKDETLKFTRRPVFVTPFGVDTDRFAPGKLTGVFKESDIVVGTVKSFESIYGIDVLVDAFVVAKKLKPQLPLKLLLVGDGSLTSKLKDQVRTAGIESDVFFAGKIPNAEVAQYHQMIDIFVSPSLEESFGVSVVEASACAKAIIAARTGGLLEVTKENETALIVRAGNAKETADAIIKFAESPELRKQFGQRARQFALDHFSWEKNLKTITVLYHQLIKGNRKN